MRLEVRQRFEESETYPPNEQQRMFRRSFDLRAP